MAQAKIWHKKYCKEFNMKYEDTINSRVFIASKLTNSKAGGVFGYNGNGVRYSNPLFKSVNKRRVYFMFYCHDFENDVQLVNEWKEFKVDPETLEKVDKPKWAKRT